MDDATSANRVAQPANASLLLLGTGWFPQTPGGMERYVYELATQLARGDRLELGGVGLPDGLERGSLRLTNLSEPDRPLPQRLWEVRRRFAQRTRQADFRDIDAINLHFALYSLPLLDLLPPDVPVTFTFHGPWALESRQEGASKLSVALKQWVEQRVFAQCDRFLVLSKAFGAILHESYGIPWSQIHVVPGGVDTHHFAPTRSRFEARAALGWPGDRPILFTTRRLVQRMGLDHLLQALVWVKAAVPEVWLAIAGKGPLRQALEQQAAELGLQHHVQFLGFLPEADLPLAYQAADLTVMPSLSLEGFGLVLLESLAAGTPALCTPVGGMPEILMPFCPDLVTDSTEPVAIAQRLIALLTGECPLPGRDLCRQYAVDQFNWQRIARQVRQVLLQPQKIR
ncbi:glycosyltransferase family 4 protein [Leptolyngbya sp. O-77]|uniref:glycosyltransferase family 4 protein n=1 Tax=Leptolyngbya sp. O-77 TaxID=1080068 RepID=UPI00074D38B1|nr:glycosyltransferase family 4 protein [Leptolyngbya sp. O-77]BAU44399.1 GDP-mannose-dependent alpha-(1-6)-phosphatidylinositol monomannoside mannosyltransferase [Leptolyngbya sp. O-77]